MKNYERTGKDSRKQAVSIRMNRSDVRNIKRLAERLGARDSDVIRFAIKLMLGKLAPLQDLSVRGRSLVPVFLESGAELMRHFELDSARLSSIFNEGVEQDRCVDPDDIQLIAMSGLQPSYAKLRVAGFRHTHSPQAANSGHTNGSGDVQNGRGHDAVDTASFEQSLRQYLYDKYLYTGVSGAASSFNPANNPGGES